MLICYRCLMRPAYLIKTSKGLFAITSIPSDHACIFHLAFFALISLIAVSFAALTFQSVADLLFFHH